MQVQKIQNSNNNYNTNFNGKLIKLGNLSVKENSAIESFMSSVADGITNGKIIAQKPYDVYVSKSNSKKNCLQIYGVYEQCDHEHPSVQFNLSKLFYNRKSSKPDTKQFRINLNRFEEEKLNNWGYSNDLDDHILDHMRKSNRKPVNGYSLWEKLLIAVRDKI